MPLSRLAALAAVLAGTAGLVWLSWPRPDTLIVVRRGGVAVVRDALGREQPLPDTVFVGGSGGRRTIRVENEDVREHRLAMFTVPAGGHTEYTVPMGTFGGACSAHPTKTTLTFVVR